MKAVLFGCVCVALCIGVGVFWAVCRAAARVERAYILPLAGRREDAEWILRRVSWQWRWGVIDAVRIEVVDEGLDEESADTVRRLCEQLGFDYVLPKNRD